jgi:nucleoside-diphosphate-sugar epimerase
VRWQVADLLDPAAAQAVVAAAAPERLLHLAWYAEHARFWTSPENLRWVEATLRLLRAFADAGGRRAVVAGTCAEYEWTPEGGVLSEDAPLRPATLYGAAKDATRRVAEAFSGVSDMELTWGRVFLLYGPGEPPGRLVPRVTRALLAGEEAEVGPPDLVRDFMDVEDVAGAFAALLDSRVTGAVNVATGEPTRIGEIVDTIADLVGRPELVRRGALPARPGEPSTLVADARRLREEVGFSPRISLRDGLATTIDWWRSESRSEAGRAG